MAAITQPIDQEPQDLAREKPPLRDGSDGRAQALSAAQERLWFLHRMAPESAAQNLQFAARLTGLLDVEALDRSLSEIWRRHDVLRASFPVVEGQPAQVIAPAGPLDLPIVDLRARDPSEQDAEVARLESEDARQPFDLTRGPLIRLRLLRLGQEEHRLLLTVHAILFDAGSFTVFLRELAALYEALSAERPSPLTEPAMQYADFARERGQWLQGEARSEHLAYWTHQLGGRPPILELPADHPRTAARAQSGARERVALPPDLAHALQTLSRREEVPLFTTLLAAFQTLLHRYSGQEDLVVGIPVDHRAAVGYEGVIGPFVNYLVLRADCSGAPSFRELLGRVRRALDEAFAHQELPFEKLVEVLRPERDPSRSPLFQVGFAFQEAALPDREVAGLTLHALEMDAGTATLDLMLHLAQGSESVHGWLEYATDLFDAATIRRMTAHFRTLLEGIVAHPDRSLLDLPLLSAGERHQLLSEWNQTGSDYPRGACLHQLVEEQARRTPDAVAVAFEQEQLTYAELDSRANQLARYLQARGVGRDVLVGICVERSLEMVVGLLGILKAGGAYVPLDPAYPRERLEFVIENAGASVLLTQHQLAGSLPEQQNHVVCLDTHWPAIARESEDPPSCDATSDHLAYVIYTSGSTGRPKGVQIPHRAVVNLLHSMRRWPGLTEKDILLAVTTLSFDIAGVEIFLPLTVGARVVVASRAVAADGVRLARKLADAGATVMQATPATWRLLLEAGWQGNDWLRIFCGGEALPRELANALLERCASLWNLYGPTETTIWSTVYPVEPGEGPVPIGQPVANTQIYVLDARLQPVPIGVPGELHIGGDGLARGYLKRPELTAEKFIPDPFSSEQGARLYKTGDLARYRPDGLLECLGRLDLQVKVRGFRIELGEIEAVLAQHPAVRESVVTAREDLPGNPRLVAYVVATQEDTPSAAELRRFVKEKLPDYMVPAAFMTLGAMPRTPNGKVDRAALPAPDLGRTGRESAFVAPRDSVECRLAGLWEEILGVRPIGLKDNFFELGGHSLLAVRLFTQIETTWGRNLPLATLFQAPTVEQLAGILRDESSSGAWSSLVRIRAGGARPPFFCMHGAGANVLYLSMLARHLPPDQPFYGLQSQGLDGEREPHTRVEEMAAHYLREIRAVQPEGPYTLGGYSFGGVVAFEMAQQLHAQGERVALLALFNTCFSYRPRYIADVSPFRARVYPLVERVEYHYDELTRLGPWAYARARARFLRVRLTRRLWRVARRIYPSVRPLPPSVDPLPPALRKVWHANLRAEREYVPQVYPGRITLFWASHTPVTDHDTRSPLGWNDYAGEGLEVHVVPGDHGTFREEPYVQVLAEKLTACLRRAQQQSDGV